MAEPDNSLSTGPSYIGDYPYLVSWAHRRPAMLVNSPAVVQHLGYWIPDQYVTNRNAWVENTQKFLDSIEDQLSKLGLKNKAPTSKPITQYPGRYQTRRFVFDWQSVPVEISFELHHEYFTLSTAIKLSDWDKDLGPATKDLSMAIQAFGEIAGARYRKIEKKEDKDINEQLRTAESLLLQEASTAHQKRISEFQKAGEIIAGVGLFPAAIGDIVAKTLGENSRIVPVATAFSFIGGIVFAFRKEIVKGFDITQNITHAAISSSSRTGSN